MDSNTINEKDQSNQHPQGTQVFKNAKFASSSLLKDEKILYAAEWSYVYWGLFMVIGFIYAMVKFSIQSEYIGSAGGIFVITLFFIAVLAILMYFSIKKSELVITNRRIILKYGIILRKTFELPIDKWESLSVDETLLGRICNFGFVKICGTGASRAIAGPIENPFKIRDYFVKAKYNNDK